MERSNPEGEPNSTVINASEGNDELNDNGVVNQEGSLIMKKTQFKLGGYARYGELSAMMNHIVYNSPSSESFEVDWAAFIKEFALGQNRWLAGL
ncbi:hypothetical protein HN51_033100 [Arachis hypogaea]